MVRALLDMLIVVIAAIGFSLVTGIMWLVGTPFAVTRRGKKIGHFRFFRFTPLT